MKVINQTKKTVLAKQLIAPKSLLDQSLGLLKHKTPAAMLLRTRFGIHTFGMSYAIDVLILDNRNRVVALRENLKHNRIFLWNPMYQTILELPSGIIKKTMTKIGDTIELNE